MCIRVCAGVYEMGDWSSPVLFYLSLVANIGHLERFENFMKLAKLISLIRWSYRVCFTWSSHLPNIYPAILLFIHLFLRPSLQHGAQVVSTFPSQFMCFWFKLQMLRLLPKFQKPCIWNTPRTEKTRQISKNTSHIDFFCCCFFVLIFISIFDREQSKRNHSIQVTLLEY